MCRRGQIFWIDFSKYTNDDKNKNNSKSDNRKKNKEELKFKPYTVNVEGINIQLSNWLSSFTEKLKYGRAKDSLDYANFIPNDLINDTPVLFQLENYRVPLLLYPKVLD